MGLAAVTEANTGDFTVKLKPKRSRSVDEVMADVRAQVKATEPELDIELTQVLQDKINDLSNAPEPIQIKIFSDDAALLAQLGPRVADAISKISGVVDVENGIDNTISGPATNFQVDPQVAARLGFTPAEVSQDATAILDGIPTTDPLIANGRPYTIRVRLRTGDAQHRSMPSRTRSSTAALGTRPAWARWRRFSSCRRRTRSGAKICNSSSSSPDDLEGSDLGGAMAKVQQTVGRSASACIGARGVRRHLSGAAEIVPRSAAGAAAGAGAGLRRAAGRVPQLSRAHRDSHLVGAFHLRRDSCACSSPEPHSTSPRSWA